MDVDVYSDPSCGWCQVALRWLAEVQRERGLVVHVRPFSLLLRDGPEGRSPDSQARRVAGLRGLRVIAALEEHDPALVTPFWFAVVTLEQPIPVGDITAALRAVGAPGDLAAAADDERWDDAIRGSMAVAQDVAGERVTLPVIVLDGTVGFTGPLLRTEPTGDDAVALWDAIVTLAATPGFYELSRPRPPRPLITALPPTPQPPLLRRAPQAQR